MTRNAAPTLQVTCHGRDAADGNEPACLLTDGRQTIELYYSGRRFYLDTKCVITSSPRTMTHHHSTTRLTSGEVRRLHAMLSSAKHGASHMEADMNHVQFARTKAGLTLNAGIVSFEASPQLDEWVAQAALLLSGVRRWRAASTPVAA